MVTKELLLRIYSDKGVRVLYSEMMEIEDYESIARWCQSRISDINAMRPQEGQKK